MQDKISVNIHHATKIDIYTGELFEQEGVIVIPVNEYFFTEIGLQVSEYSVHGQFINRFFKNDRATLNSLIDDELREQGHKITRVNGSITTYLPLGTTVCIEKEGKTFLLCAVTHTNSYTLDSYANLADFSYAYAGLCKKLREVLGDNDLVIPVIGSGLSRLGLPINLSIMLNIINLRYHTYKEHFANQVKLVIYEGHAHDIDYEAIVNLLSHKN